MTEAGGVLGTTGYMSPEQACGKPVDKRADIWAFGCVLYEMLTGKAAFRGDDDASTLARVLERDPDMRPLPTALSPAVRRTLELCLQKDVKKRVADIRDVRLALEGEFAAPGAETRPLWRRSLPLAAALVVGVLVTGAYMAIVAPPAAPPAALPVLPVTRFVITPPATAPLTNLGGLDLAISPDGQRIAYFAENPDRGGVALYLRELDGLESRRIPGTEITETPGTLNPFFSPDGKSIGFLFPGRGVVRVAVDGGPPVKMFDAPEPTFVGASWGPDDTLVFSSAGYLRRASARAAAAPVSLTPEKPRGFYANPQLLPGGRAVLFSTSEGGDIANVAVLDLDSGEQKTLVENGGHATYVDTGHILFARGTALMAVPFDAAELALTGEAVAVLENVRHPNAQSASDYAVSATGTLAYVPGRDQADRAALVWVDRTGVVLGRAVSNLLDNPRDPRLSPNQERLVLTTGAIGDGRVWSFDLRGQPPIPLAVANNNLGAVWSPDSRQIALVAFGAALSLPIYTLPADGSVLAPQRLPIQGAAGGVPQTWSTAGELFFVEAPLGNSRIRVTPVAGGEVHDVVATDYNEFDAALSPNGRWLAYTSNRTGQNEVWVQAYPNGVAVRVSGSGGYEPLWSADGRELFYMQGNSIMGVGVQTEPALSFATPVQLFSGPYRVRPIAVVRSYDVAHDGRFLMILPEDTAQPNGAPASIVVVQNWFEELRHRVPAQR